MFGPFRLPVDIRRAARFCVNSHIAGLLDHRDIIFYLLFKGEKSLNATQHSDALRQRELSAQFIDTKKMVIEEQLVLDS